MTQPVSPDKPAGEALAQRFHETYERLAPSFGYETREASAKPWAEVPENNRNLMTAVCTEILSRTPPPSVLDEEVVAVLFPIFAELDDGINGHGHGHGLPGVWDDDISNGANAGKPCEWCAQWADARALLTRFKDRGGNDTAPYHRR